jgi:hypothetical protein
LPVESSVPLAKKDARPSAGPVRNVFEPALYSSVVYSALPLSPPATSTSPLETGTSTCP